MEPACLHKVGPVARVAAQQERFIFYHGAGWPEGYCKKKEAAGGGEVERGELRSQGDYQTIPLCLSCPSFVPQAVLSPDLRADSGKLCTFRRLLPVL